MSSTPGASRKAAAMDFLRLAGSGRPREAFAKYAAAGFTHHNPWFGGDAESLIVGMEESAAQNPGKVLTIQRALEDGDLVAVHSRVQQNPADRGGAVVHIFRFEQDRVAELCDVGQPVPEHSPNQHGMF
jgi:predicted SnoaL-like aldol condensation-catalyzing enzyme